MPEKNLMLPVADRGDSEERDIAMKGIFQLQVSLHLM
jgi:hypothetical protein